MCHGVEMSGLLNQLTYREDAFSSGSDEGRENLSINQATGRKLYWSFEEYGLRMEPRQMPATRGGLVKVD